MVSRHRGLRKKLITAAHRFFHQRGGKTPSDVLLWAKLRRIGQLSQALGITIDLATFDDATFERLYTVQAAWQDKIDDDLERQAKQ